MLKCFFFFSSRRRHTRFDCDWSSDVCSSDLWVEALHPDDRERIASEWRSAVARGQTFASEFRFVHSDGRITRSEERRVGKECRSRWSPNNKSKKKRLVKIEQYFNKSRIRKRI